MTFGINGFWYAVRFMCSTLLYYEIYYENQLIESGYAEGLGPFLERFDKRVLKGKPRQ